MIPALLAVPLAESVLGTVVNAFSPQQAQSSAPAPFTPHLNRAQATAPAEAAPSASPSGTMTKSEWNQLSETDKLAWLKGLAGSHVHATDASGRTFSGVVGNVQQMGGALAMNIGGHLVSLSQLKQISWSPSVTAAA